MVHALDDTVKALEVLPHKMANAGVLWGIWYDPSERQYCIAGPLMGIDIWDGGVQNLRL
jgi:hypothetical protein